MSVWDEQRRVRAFGTNEWIQQVLLSLWDIRDRLGRRQVWKFGLIIEKIEADVGATKKRWIRRLKRRHRFFGNQLTSQPLRRRFEVLKDRDLNREPRLPFRSRWICWKGMRCQWQFESSQISTSSDSPSSNCGCYSDLTSYEITEKDFDSRCPLKKGKKEMETKETLNIDEEEASKNWNLFQ